MAINRRQFLTYLGASTAALTLSTVAPAVAAGATYTGATADHLFGQNPGSRRFNANFKAIQPSAKDDLVLPAGYRYDILALTGDKINAKGDTFGFNTDLNIFFPINGSSEHGLLFTNHEYMGELEYFINGYDSLDETKPNTRTAEQIQKYLYNLGASVMEIKKAGGKWTRVADSARAFRVNGFTQCRLTGPAAGSEALGGVYEVTGTFENCSGGITLWNTALSGEENFQNTVRNCKLPNESHYGWIVEVDPFDPAAKPKKHTALGRFAHENTAMIKAKTGQIVVYMGDDATDQCVYKFVSKGKFDPRAGADNSKLLEEGVLYVANFAKGKWVALDYETNDALKKAVDGNKQPMFLSQADVCLKTRDAAKVAGGTPMDRPEDIEINPVDGSIYMAMTNNAKHGNFFGQIIRMVEKDNDHLATEFSFEIFSVGGPQSGYACPDNLAFDSAGNLWVVTDISSGSLNSGIYRSFGNNGMYFIPTSGKDAGKAFRFASGPVGCEMTGPWFTPDEKTLFLSVQHPGENLTSYDKPTSSWGQKAGVQAMPGVVAITGF